ncbi:MAG TPA: hypothetical protein VK988_07040 [Acidimicrobiales bacterium]|nr:hypothetical protein [Acidimicrobiales bacterium]
MEALWARLSRADNNLAELNRLVEEGINNGEAHSVFAEQDPDTGEMVLCGVGRDIPRSWGPLVGDIVHGLRAALDNLVWSLSAHFSSSPPPPNPIPRKDRWRKVAFPVVTDPSKWATVAGKCLWVIEDRRPHLVDEFKDLQPFHTRQNAPEREPLAILEELWNIDKHRHPPLVALWTEVDPLDILAEPTFPGGRFRVVSTSSSRPLEADAVELARFKPYGLFPQAGVEVNVNYGIGVDIAFNQGAPAFGGEVIDTLQACRADVAKAIRRFAPELG